MRCERKVAWQLFAFYSLYRNMQINLYKKTRKSICACRLTVGTVIYSYVCIVYIYTVSALCNYIWIYMYVYTTMYI